MQPPKTPSDLVLTTDAEDNHNFKDLLSQIRVPMRVIGGLDDFCPIKETADGIPDAKLILYEGFGHNAWSDNGKKFNADVLKFLDAD